jgi:hypothetical protein
VTAECCSPGVLDAHAATNSAPSMINRRMEGILDSPRRSCHFRSGGRT